MKLQYMVPIIFISLMDKSEENCSTNMQLNFTIRFCKPPCDWLINRGWGKFLILSHIPNPAEPEDCSLQFGGCESWHWRCWEKCFSYSWPSDIFLTLQSIMRIHHCLRVANPHHAGGEANSSVPHFTKEFLTHWSLWIFIPHPLSSNCVECLFQEEFFLRICRVRIQHTHGVLNLHQAL